ncbi:DUF1648 domain-containing protein [Kitasatospora sp. NPDC127111]|uniref:DUF1648 domain-containing protein n=1 Tax=Kitasatospora sp. NPDC127111 TaxID=3345363 RepID=UPI0036263629
MNAGGNRIRGTRWGAVAWAAAVYAMLVALPAAAAGRLPERVASHWSGGGGPDGSMPFWAVPVFPAALWTVLLAGFALSARWTGDPARHWHRAALAAAGVLVAGAQASIVHANLDRAVWTEAGDVGLDVALVLTTSALTGLVVGLAARRTTALASAGPGNGPADSPADGPAGGPQLDIPAGERFAWLSRAVNGWLLLTAALSGLLAAGTAVAALAGLIGSPWPVLVPLVIVAIAVYLCSSVQALVTPKGLEVAFGPAGWPVRRWPVEAIESARAEQRTPAQVGGWGYRLSGLGTTVMLRRGDCLVIHPHQGADFAVSVDDAERGAALLNSLAARRTTG